MAEPGSGPGVVTPEAHVFPRPGGVVERCIGSFRLRPRHKPPGPSRGVTQHPHCSTALCSLGEGGVGRGGGTVPGRLLTDTLETGDRPLGHVRVLITQALGQAGRTSFTLEARVADIPFPGVLVVTLDPDVCVFDGRGGRARGACKKCRYEGRDEQVSACPEAFREPRLSRWAPQSEGPRREGRKPPPRPLLAMLSAQSLSEVSIHLSLALLHPIHTEPLSFLPKP